MRLTHREFEAAVEDALKELPSEFAEAIKNIAIVIEDEPGEDDLEIAEDDHELLGIYRGVSLPERTFDMLPSLPDQIAIFRGPILRTAGSRAEAVNEIRDTVIHELGHYFGLGDEEMEY